MVLRDPAAAHQFCIAMNTERKNIHHLAGDTARLLAGTDFRDDAAAREALERTEQALEKSGAMRQAGYRILNIIRIHHLAVSSGDKQFFGYALQKAFREWMSLAN